MIRITVTGSECTGKSTLASALAQRFGTVWVPEYARSFVEATGRPPTVADVDAIARGQIALEDSLGSDAGPLLILDTDLLSTVIYARHYYGSCPTWIEQACADRYADLYLLADIDVPWEPDGAQRDRGEDRPAMHRLFRNELAVRRLPFREIRGGRRRRLEAAVKAVGELLSDE